jgi:hypothetical protein
MKDPLYHNNYYGQIPDQRGASSSDLESLFGEMEYEIEIFEQGQ